MHSINMKDKRAIESETIAKIILWIILGAVVALAIKTILERFGILS